MSSDENDLEPISPEEARELFIADKEMNRADATVREYRYRTRPFVEWCEQNGIDNMNDLTGRHLHEFRKSRKEDGLKNITISSHMSSLRVFLKWCESIEAVPDGLYERIVIPDVGPDERTREEKLDSDDAREILDYLSRYEYASLPHVMVALFWETGIRMGTLRGIDVDDVDFDREAIHIRHRPSEDTPLKNGSRGERKIAITSDLAGLLEDYVDDRRENSEDDFGRDPLLSTEHGRITRSSIRRIIYRVTSPCYRGAECPGCEGQTGVRCPEAVSPHSIRRGSITHFLTNDVPVEIVSDRMNVGQRILDEHYDGRSEDVKMEQRRGYLDNI